MKQAPPFWPMIIALAILKFALPLILQSPVYELQRDEYLYYEPGQHSDDKANQLATEDLYEMKKEI